METERRTEALRRALRAELRRARRSVPRQRRRAAARALAAHLWRLPSLQRARRVAVYLANDGEIDPGPFTARLVRAGRACYLPVLRERPRFAKRLVFARHRPGGPTRTNRYGIPEPDGSPALLESRRIDVVIVPLVAFDRHGQRLGMGGGYFDRTLAYQRRARRWRRPRLVGVAYQLQQRDRLPVAPWDVPLHEVVTERGRISRYATTAGPL